MLRANLFGKSQIVMGDRTTHGGVVISGNPINTWYGIPIARKGDKVYCPKCSPHIFEIAEGLPNCTDTDAGLPLATEGHLTTCGAVLIAETAPDNDISIARAVENGTAHDEQFQIKDEHNNPIQNLDYTIKSTDGRVIHGTTDEEGRTIRIFSENPEQLSVHFGHIA